MRLATAGIIAAAIISAYSGSISAGFHWDDGHTITRNPAVRSTKAAFDTFINPRGFSAYGASMIRPLTVITYAINYHLTGFDTKSWHVLNLLAHLVAALAMMWIAATLLGRIGFDEEQSLWGGLAAGLFFALNPIQEEAVNYFSARSELLASSFCLLGLYFHLRDGDKRTKAEILASICFVAGMASRESAAVFPAMAVLCDLITTQTDITSRLKKASKTWPYWLLVLIYFIYRRMLLGIFTERDFVRGPADQISVGMWAIGLYHKLILFPWNLSVSHPDPTSPAITALFWVGILLVVVELIFSIVLIKSRPLFPVAVGIFYMGLLPTLAIPLNYPAAEHRVYMAMAGPALIFGWLIAGLRAARPRLIAGLLLTVTVFLAATTRMDSRRWLNDFNLWSAAIKTHPADYLAWTQYGKVMKESGRLNRAIFAYNRSIAIEPNSGAYINLSIACGLVVDKNCAGDAIYKALQIDRDNPLAHFNLGLDYFEESRLEEAESEFREAIRIMPVFPEAHKNLAVLLLSKNSPVEKEALEHLELSIEQNPYQEEADIIKKKIAELRGRLKGER